MTLTHAAHTLNAQLRRFVDANPVGVLATSSLDGRPRQSLVYFTRVDDRYVSLVDRAALANAQPNCVFVSIHFDAAKPEATGVETYYATHQIPWLPFLQPAALESLNKESQSLASIIQESLAARTQAVNRGTSLQQFFVITNVRHPAVLVEGGFLTNKNEIGKLADANYREQLAVAISDGILKYRDTVKASGDTVDGTGP